MTTAREDWRRPISLAAVVSWHAARIISRPTNVRYSDRCGATGLSNAQVRGRHDDDGVHEQVGGQQHAVICR